MPPLGTRVTYEVVADAKSGRPRAENVQPLDGFHSFTAPQMGVTVPHQAAGINLSNASGARWSQQAQHFAPADAFLTGGRQSGSITRDSGKFGFIAQDAGGDNMFVVPSSATVFGNVIPPIGTRVTYTVTTDMKTGRPRAEDVQPEDAQGFAGCGYGAGPGKGSSGYIPRSGYEWSGAPVHMGDGKGGAYGPACSSMGKGGPVVPYGMQKGSKSFGGYQQPAPNMMGMRLTGAMHADNGKFGFIQQDSGLENMFVMPSSCPAFGGAFPPQGTRVSYGVVLDGKTGKPRAEDVQPEQPGAVSGTMLVDSGKFGFIQQDSGEDNMFIMPTACAMFCEAGRLPPIGTRLMYQVVMDEKTGRARADHVQMLA